MNKKNNLSIEICANFTQRLDSDQKKEIKIGALIAIKNFIKESKVNDPILYNFLIDTITDREIQVRNYVLKIIKEIANQEIYKILEEKHTELSGELKKETTNLLKTIKNKLKPAPLFNT